MKINDPTESDRKVRLPERKLVRQRARALLRKHPFDEQAIRRVIEHGVNLRISNLYDKEGLAGCVEYRKGGTFYVQLDHDLERMGTPEYRSHVLLHELAHCHFALYDFDEGKPVDYLDPYELLLNALARAAVRRGNQGSLTPDDWLFLCHHNQYAKHPKELIQKHRRQKALRTLAEIVAHDPIDFGIVEASIGAIKLVSVDHRLEALCPARNLMAGGTALCVWKRWSLTTVTRHLCHSVVHLHIREQLQMNDFPFGNLEDPEIHPFVEENARPWVGHDRIRDVVRGQLTSVS